MGETGVEETSADETDNLQSKADDMEHSVFYKSYVVCLCVLLTLSGANCDKLLMLMVDGYSSDFLRNHTDDLPGFKQFFSIGSRAEHVDPQFPTMTFPNYYTLMTGS